MQFVRPTNIASPVTGALCKPRIHKVKRGDKVYEEAHWYCPDSGTFVRKGIVRVIEEAKDDPYSDSGTNAARQGIEGHMKENPKPATGLPDKNKQIVAEVEDQRIKQIASALRNIPTVIIKQALSISHPDISIQEDPRSLGEDTGDVSDPNYLGKSGTEHARAAAVKFAKKPHGSYHSPKATGGFPTA